MQNRTPKHGARVYYYDDGVILIKQTRKDERTGAYVIDSGPDGQHRERHVDPGNDAELAEVIRAAGQGQL